MTLSIDIDLDDVAVAALAAIAPRGGTPANPILTSAEDRAAGTVQQIAHHTLTACVLSIRAAYLAGNHDVTEWPGAEPDHKSTIH